MKWNSLCHGNPVLFCGYFVTIDLLKLDLSHTKHAPYTQTRVLGFYENNFWGGGGEPVI